jgi:hypothetical protein
MYFSTDYPSKAAARRAMANGEVVRVMSNSPFEEVTDGTHTVEGPHYPKPHTFYGTVTVRNGIVTAIK